MKKVLESRRENYGQEDTSRQGAKTRKLKEGNFRNVRGTGGILLFIGRKLRYLKWRNQSKSDTWHAPKKK